jgi:3-keto-disaccharide hydrolase
MTRRLAIILGLFASASVYAAGNAPAKKPPAKPEVIFLDPESAGIDYKLQGEYEGSKWGAQVIAMGDHKFHAVFLPGGLPGAGWDAKNRYESEGAMEGDNVTLKPTDKVAWEEGHFAPPVEIHKGFDATISGDTITTKTDTGESITLKKTLRHSPTEGAKPPAGAIVLFDGTSADAFEHGEMTPNKLLKAGCDTKQKFTDFTVHVEFYLPFKPFARSQGRANSGVYCQHRYETQVLDSFGVKGMDNQCGGIYTKHAPSVNMCYPPLTWQTYDIDFTAARYEGGKKKSDAIISVKHNGVLIQDQFKIDGPTGGGIKEDPKDDIQTGPLHLQGHGNPVVFRNVWLVEKK